MDFEIQVVTKELWESPFFKEPYAPPSSQKGLPDGANVGARVPLQGWHNPESTILDPYLCLFSSWGHPSRIIFPPCHVDVEASRGPQPIPHLGASQDRWLPFYPEDSFEMLATKLAVSWSHWRTERTQSGFGSKTSLWWAHLRIQCGP